MSNPRQQGPRINNRLLGLGSVRVVDFEGNHLGIMPVGKALDKARAAGLDLVLVSDTSNPPVCKIIDYGKFKYEQSKNTKPKNVQEIKTLRLSPRIGQNDLNVIIKKSTEFLNRGDKVKLVCIFRGRELVHADLGYDKITAVCNALSEISKIDITAKLEGRMITTLLSPIKKS